MSPARGSWSAIKSARGRLWADPPPTRQCAQMPKTCSLNCKNAPALGYTLHCAETRPFGHTRTYRKAPSCVVGVRVGVWMTSQLQSVQRGASRVRADACCPRCSERDLKTQVRVQLSLKPDVVPTLRCHTQARSLCMWSGAERVLD